MTRPTIGRMVWFWPARDATGFAVRNSKYPFAATVTFVHEGDEVALAVLDHAGNVCGVSHVARWDGNGPRTLQCWQWPERS